MHKLKLTHTDIHACIVRIEIFRQTLPPKKNKTHGIKNTQEKSFNYTFKLGAVELGQRQRVFIAIVKYLCSFPSTHI